MEDRAVQLQNHPWTLGERIGDPSGMGEVYAASAPGVNEPAVVKLIPKLPGTEREMLFVDLHDVRNVVPVIDSGDDDRHYILAMPRAEKSLKAHLDQHGRLSETESATLLSDIAAALEDLAGRVAAVIHRDLKPQTCSTSTELGVWPISASRATRRRAPPRTR